MTQNSTSTAPAANTFLAADAEVTVGGSFHTVKIDFTDDNPSRVATVALLGSGAENLLKALADALGYDLVDQGPDFSDPAPAADLVSALTQAAIPYCRVVTDEPGRIVLDTEDTDLPRSANRDRVAAAVKVLAKRGLTVSRKDFLVTVTF